LPTFIVRFFSKEAGLLGVKKPELSITRLNTSHTATTTPSAANVCNKNSD
jgi:hypothetical protein